MQTSFTHTFFIKKYIINIKDLNDKVDYLKAVELPYTDFLSKSKLLLHDILY